jgi:hypothetical protein
MAPNKHRRYHADAEYREARTNSGGSPTEPPRAQARGGIGDPSQSVTGFLPHFCSNVRHLHQYPVNALCHSTEALRDIFHRTNLLLFYAKVFDSFQAKVFDNLLAGILGFVHRQMSLRYSRHSLHGG